MSKVEDRVRSLPQARPGEPSGEQPETYTIVKGDTLWSIAKRFLGDPLLWRELWAANRDIIANPHRIFPGQKIRLQRVAVDEAAQDELKQHEPPRPRRANLAETPREVRTGAQLLGGMQHANQLRDPQNRPAPPAPGRADDDGQVQGGPASPAHRVAAGAEEVEGSDEPNRAIGAIKLGAVKRLQFLQGKGQIEIGPAEVRVLDDGLQAEVEALANLALGENTKLNGRGYLCYADGKYAAEAHAELNSLIGKTQLTATGDLTLKDGVLDHDFKATLTRTFEGARWRADGALVVDGLDRQQLQLVAQAVGPRATFGASGMLLLDHGDIAQGKVNATVTSARGSEVSAYASLQRTESRSEEDGYYVYDRAKVVRAGASAMVPVNAVLSVGGGGNLGKIERYRISVPQEQRAALEAREEGYARALAGERPEALHQGLPGLRLERALSKDASGELKVALGQSFALPGGVGALEVAASFGKSMSKSDVVNLSVDYREDDPAIADVTLSKINVKEIASEIAARAGLNVTAAELTTVLHPYLAYGMDIAGQLAGPAGQALAAKLGQKGIQKLLEYADAAKVEISMRRGHTTQHLEALQLRGFDLRKPEDRQAFDALVVDNDPKLALEAGKLFHSRVRDVDKRTQDLLLKAFTHELAISSQDFAAFDVHKINLGDGRVAEIRMAEGGASQTRKGPFEDHEYQAGAFTVSVDGAVQESLAAVSFTVDDSMYRRGEQRRLKSAVDSIGLQVLQERKGKVKKVLGFMLPNYGDGKLRMNLVVRPGGAHAIFNKEPRTGAFDAMEIAAALKKVEGLPPGELGTSLPTDLLSTALAKGQRLPNLSHLPASYEALNPGHTSTLTRALSADIVVWQAKNGDKGVAKARTILRNQAKHDRVDPEVAAYCNQLSDAQLDTLIKQAAASAYLLDYANAVKDRSPGGSDDTKEEDSRRWYYQMTKRDAAEDLWIVEQGLRARDFLSQPEVARVRAGMVTSPAEAEKLVTETARNAFKEFHPNKSVLGTRKDNEALVFYGSLIRGLSSDKVLASVQVDADEYDLLAVSKGADPELIKSLMAQRSSQAALQGYVDKAIQGR